MGRIGIRQYTLIAILALIAVVATLYVVQKTMFTQAAPGINKTINFQGKMTDDNGLNVADGTYQFVFSMYTVASGGAATWTETVNLDVVDGIFHHQLGSSTPLPGSVDFDSDNIFLGITFNSDPDGEMSPRIQLTASPYAFNSDKLDGLDASDFVQLSPSVAQTGDIAITGNMSSGSATVVGDSTAALDVQDSSNNSVFRVDTTGAYPKVVLNDGAGTSLYGISDWDLVTDGNFRVANGGATQVAIGDSGGNASISFGMGSDVTLFRSAVGALTLGGALIVEDGVSLNSDTHLDFETGTVAVRAGFDATYNILKIANYKSGGITQIQTGIFQVQDTVNYDINFQIDTNGNAQFDKNLTIGGVVRFESLTNCSTLETDSNGDVACGTGSSGNFVELQAATPGSQQVGNINVTGTIIAQTSFTGTSFQSRDQTSASTNSASITLRTGNAGGSSSNSGNITIDTGTATGMAGAISLGSANASGLTLGRSGLTTLNAGNFTVQGNTILGDASGDTLTLNGTNISLPNDLNFDSNTLFIDSANNRTGFGTINTSLAGSTFEMTAPNAEFGAVMRVQGSLTSSTNPQSGIYAQPWVSPSSASSQYYTAFTAFPYSSSNNLTNGTIYGINAGVYFDSVAGTLGTGMGFYGGAINAQGGTISTAYGAYLQNQNLSSGTIGNSYANFIANPVNGGGTVTNNYGIFVQNQTSGNSDYGIYIQGADTYALWVDNGVSRLDGNLTVGGSLQFSSLTSCALLQTDGSGNVSCGAGGGGSGVTTVGALDGGTPSANGAFISGTTLYLQSASATQAGLVTTGAQTFAGVKTFTSQIVIDGSSDVSQLVIEAHSTQSNTSPLIMVRNSGGDELFRIHSNGNDNLAMGYRAGYSLTTGGYNLLFGSYAGYSLLDGEANVALGEGALEYAEDGSNNMAIGTGALKRTVSGNNSIGIGTGAGYWANGDGYNVIIGSNAGFGVDGSTFSYSTIIGHEAGNDLTSGNNNILIGYRAGDNLTSGANNLILGHNLDAASATGSNQLNIGGVLTGNTSTLAANFTGSLTVQGNTVLGDASGDTLTITGTSVSTPNNLNFDSNTLFVDAANDRVGVGTATPSELFSVGHNSQLIISNSGHLTTEGRLLTTRNVLGSNDYVIGATGSPLDRANSAMLRLGNAISGGNIDTNGGTYFGINAPASGAGSAADILHFQKNGSTLLKLDTNGEFTIAGQLTVGGSLQFSSLTSCTSLETDGSGNVSCGAGGGGGVTTIGTINSQTKSANGAVISGSSIVLQTADANFPGLVSTAGQSFSGVKNFNDSVNFNGGVTLGNQSTDALTITSNAVSLPNGLNFDSNTFYIDAANNRVAIGTTSTTQGVLTVSGTVPNIANAGAILVQATLSSATNAQYGMRLEPVIAPSSASSQYYGGFFAGPYSNSSNLSSGAIMGASFGPYYEGTGLLGSSFGLRGRVFNASSGTIGGAYGIQVDAPVNSGTITTNYGIQIVDVTTSNIGTSYGIYVGQQSAATNNYGLYIQGADTYALWVDSGVTRLDGNLTVGGSVQFSSLTSCTSLQTDGSGNVSCGAGGGGSEWVDGGSFLRPADSSGAEDVVIGGTSTGAADIWLQATGGAIFNQQGAAVDFRVGSSSTANMLMVDGTNNRIGVGNASPVSIMQIGEYRESAPSLTFGSDSFANVYGVSAFNNHLKLWAPEGIEIIQSYTGTAIATINSNGLTLVGQLTIGTADTTGTLLVLDTKTSSGDPTGVDGAMYYNSAYGGFRCYSGEWRFCGEEISPRFGYTMKDDFLMASWAGDFGELPWLNSSNNGTFEQADADSAARPGQLRLGSGTASGHFAVLGLGNDSSWGPGQMLMIGGGEEMEFSIKVDTLSTSAQEYDIRAGFCNSLSASECRDGMYFEYDRNSSTNWRIVSANNSTRTKTTTSTAVTTSWAHFRIKLNSAGTSAQFFINDVSVGTITTNLPTGRNTGIAFGITKQVGSTARHFLIDYMYARNSFSTAR